MVHIIYVASKGTGLVVWSSNHQPNAIWLSMFANKICCEAFHDCNEDGI